MRKNSPHPGMVATHAPQNSSTHSCNIIGRPTAVLSIAALSLGLTGLGSVALPAPEAAAAQATATAQGSFTDALEAPDTMEFTAAPVEIAEVDEQTWDTDHTGPTSSPYQAFQLDHPGAYAPVTWTGVIDPSREVSLLVYNSDNQTWDELRSTTGSAPQSTVLEAYVGEQYADDAGQIYVAVTAEDGYMTGSERWAPDDSGVTGEFADPADYDFSIAHVTDTQFLSEGAVDPNLDEVAQERFAAAYRDQMEWIVDNAEQRNISYVAHTGDIIENWMLPHHSEDQAREEFEFASEMQSIIDDAGIPNGIIPGNHDNGWGTFGNDMFNDYFPAERYEEASASWQNADYGGPWEQGDNSAHYDLFEADGHQFIAVYLPYGHNTAQRNWANDILQAFPDRDAFLFTHAYLRASSNSDASKAAGNIGYGDNGHLLRHQVVERNANIVMVSSGHYHGTTWNQNDNGDGGPVFEMLGDYQNYEVGGERNTGFMRLLQFDLDAGEVRINTYSPKLDEMGATEYDPAGRYTAATDEYTAPLALSTRGTTLMTDQMLVGDQEEVVDELPEDQPTPEPTEPPTEPETPEPVDELVIEQQADVTMTVGAEIEPMVVGVNDEDANVEFSGLPAGLVGVPDSREISGIPEEVGAYEVTVTAADNHGRQTQMTFTITVEQATDDGTDEDIDEPAEDEIPGDTTGDDVEVEQQPDVDTGVDEVIEPIEIVVNINDETVVDNSTVNFVFNGLPEGLTVDTGTGQISGTPTESGTFEITVVATTEDGTETQMTFVITVASDDELDVEPVGQVEQDEDTAETAGTGDRGTDNETPSSGFAHGLADTGAGATLLMVAGALALIGLGTAALVLHRRKRS